MRLFEMDKTVILKICGYRCECSLCGSVICGVPSDKIKFCYHCGSEFTDVQKLNSIVIDTKFKDLTDEERAIFDSWIDNEAIHTGVSIYDEL